ncbi:MAG: dodecin domain-containing protein [Ignavibacteria bacterium]|nr:MAG: dodecin domain-containing protein [Ignavibacteria bacterium]
MAKTFEIITRVGISYESISDAVKTVVEDTNSKNQVSWFEVVEQRGRVTQDGQIEYQVTVKLGIKSE